MLRILITGVMAVGLLGAAVQAPARAYDITATDVLATQAQVASVIAYWLNGDGQALAAATPYLPESRMVARRVFTGGPSPDGRPGLVPGADPERKAATRSKNVNLPRTTGKVFFHGADGRPHWCSATSVQADYRNLVATAGHCVYDIGSAAASPAATLRDWVFVPGYYQRRTPFGVYVGKQAFTHHDFATYRDLDRDYAFVTVYNGLAPSWGRSLNEAQYNAFSGGVKYKVLSRTATTYVGVRLTDAGRLGDRVGGQGLAYNQQVGRPVFVFGHPTGTLPPGNAPQPDRTLRWSYGRPFKAQDLSVKAEELIGVRSGAMDASGAAWLAGYRNSRRLGYLNGLTLGVSDADGDDRADTSVSAYFDGELYGVYSAARHLWSGSVPFNGAYEITTPVRSLL
ncbi:serine protease [Planotetraspora sp. GP83]|uniref:trypsin-like serine peptidase n=1 Tax=Planotetraspora sp. GP83 TaxID=3156264 RepID=UPI0035161A84